MKTSLDKKISAFEKDRKLAAAPMFGKMTGESAGRAGYELVIATLFFAGIGFLIDIQLDTTPWISLVLFFIGFATGVYNAWRTLAIDGETVGARYKNTPISDSDADKTTQPPDNNIL